VIGTLANDQESEGLSNEPDEMTEIVFGQSVVFLELQNIWSNAEQNL
jgi:hypothetical protein